MFPFKSLSLFATIGALIASAHAETHTVIFDNRCGFGTPTLISGPNILGIGNGPFTFNGPLISAIAYLQTGGCGFNGEGCTLIETTLINPSPSSGGSDTDISLIPPHSFSVTSGFGYFNGCDGAGADSSLQASCEVNNVNLAITFCD
ncbi:glycopeptide [Dendrothele bispora CBS 962.96]|uniref:Glycopeptide n=1 Tax=Dendrothele bispora (strain CBS 962.96) TaxID=1314807 RepID=A0A4S8KW21_DENBC|nr:glycopeptide [Dendrothele bispora CBS 962.96]